MRLVDIDSLKGCAIIRPTSSEEIAHIQSCSGLIAHKDIPTAYDVEAVVAELEALPYGRSFHDYAKKGIVHKYLEKDDVLEIVRGKE